METAGLTVLVVLVIAFLALVCYTNESDSRQRQIYREQTDSIVARYDRQLKEMPKDSTKVRNDGKDGRKKRVKSLPASRDYLDERAD